MIVIIIIMVADLHSFFTILDPAFSKTLDPDHVSGFRGQNYAFLKKL
jgi:hypothetical protein